MTTMASNPPMLPHQIPVADLPAHFKVDLQRGLTDAEAKQRFDEHGPNALQEAKRESAFQIAVRQFNSVIVWILAAAAIISFVLEDTVEGWAIIAVVLINAITGFVLEWNARQSMEALRQMDTPPARVLRNGRIHEISSEELTIGDVLIVEAGDVVAADANLFDINQLEVNESSLTGESLPVAKETGIPEADAPLGDQHNRLFKGTAVTAGNGKAVVTGIGQDTELGKIATMVEEAERTATPLEEKLDSLARVLIWVTLGLAILFLGVGLLRGEETESLIKTSVALAIAAIPEGMSVVSTIALAYGMLRLARKKVIVKRLSAVETLGSTNVIFTDKTGTLTQNRIEVHAIQTPEGYAALQIDAAARKAAVVDGDQELPATENSRLLMLTGILCNNADYDTDQEPHKEIGDPVEVALLKWAYSAGNDIDTLKSQLTRQAEKAFSSDTRIMATLHEVKDGQPTGMPAISGKYVVAVKGAIEEVMERCTGLDEETRQTQQEVSEQMATDGLRTLGFAWRTTDTKPGDDFAGSDLTYLGLIGFLDPPRTEVTPALEECRKAGIKVIMVTGDHPATALTIARQVKLVDEDEKLVLTGKDLKPIDELSEAEKVHLMESRVFARVNPAQKLDMIDLYQQHGDIVGMTGDGVNDAPALKKSDIGIAMGLRGTQVAAETADMVLKDDSFASIVKAIGQGRVIFENIRKFVLFLLSCNLSEIFVVTFAGFLNVGNPLLPLQILFINIVTDVFPALALGVGRENRQLMHEPPRDPKQPILIAADWRLVVAYALAMTVSVLGIFWIGIHELGFTQAEANTVTFYSLSVAQLFHVFNLYSGDVTFRRLFTNEITRNGYVWGAILLCLGILLLTYFVPFLRDVLSIQELTAAPLELILAAGLLPVVLIQLLRKVTGWGH